MEKVSYWETHVETMPKAELRRLQLKRLKSMSRYVYEHSPFYRRRFKEHGVEPADLKALEDLRQFPFTTKDDLREHAYPYGGDLLCVPREKLVCLHMTSGTTGQPTVNLYTSKDYETWMNAMARVYVTAGVKPGDVVMSIYGYGLFTGGLGFHQSAFLVGATVIPWSVGRTEALIQTLKDFEATVMTGTPSYQYYIAEMVKKAGLDPEKDLHLRITMPGAEIWTEEMRRRIEEGLALRQHGGGARNIYGATELCGPGAGVECRYQQGFHFWTDHWYLEIIDPDTLEPVGPGEQGEMVVTHLTWESMPLIRYRLRDITVLDEEPCECGRIAFPRCLWIQGRVDDVIHYKGSKIWPSAVQEALLEFPEIQEYQIVVDKSVLPYDLVVRAEVNGRVVTDEYRGQVEAALNKTLFVEPRLEFVPPGTLPRYEGKSKRVVIKEAA